MGIKGRKKKASRQLDTTSPAVPQSPAESFPKHVVVAFLEELQRAHQYFLFKDYLRLDCAHLIQHSMNLHSAYYIVESADELTSKFNFLLEEDIWHCIKDCLDELNAKHDTYMKNLKIIEELLADNMFNLLVEEEDILDALQDDIFKLEAEQVPVMMDLKEIRNPVFYLVSRMREEGYVLDDSLEVELEKLKTFAPMYYHDCLNGWKPPGMVEAGTVTVSNISLDVSEIDIRNFFRCQTDNKYVRTRSTSKGQIAYITFKDLDEANEMHRFTGMKISHLSMYIKSPCYSGYAPLVVQPICDEDARYVDEKAEDDLHIKQVEAHYKYGELKTYYSQLSQSQSKDVDGRKKEKRWGTRPWMVMEAMANGGYTVGGQSLEAFYTFGGQSLEAPENKV